MPVEKLLPSQWCWTGNVQLVNKKNLKKKEKTAWDTARVIGGVLRLQFPALCQKVQVVDYDEEMTVQDFILASAEHVQWTCAKKAGNTQQK